MVEKIEVSHSRRHLRIDILAVILFCLITFGIWAAMMPLSARFADYGASTHSLGQITGLIGMVLFALTLVLTTKNKMIENSAGGLDKVYTLHRTTGALSFIFLLFHPLLLVFKYIPSDWAQAAIYLWPSRSWGVNFGMLSLAIMIVLLGMTFYISMKYKDWKISHKILGVAFIIGCLHTFLVTTDISRNPYLKIWMILVCLLGVVAHIYGSYLIKLLKKQHKYNVVNVEQNGKFTTITLVPTQTPMEYKAGQFTFIKFHTEDKTLNEAHPFTIASSPDALPDNQIRYVIKSLGDFTSRLSEIKNGTLVIIDGPYGKFDYTKYNNEQIWIAGGVGITPFLSFAQSIHTSNFKKKITLYYCTRDGSEQVHYDELAKISETTKNFKVMQFCASEKGQITAEIIDELTSLKNKDIFLCGPPPMMNAIKAQLIANGVKKNHIHMEEFGFK